MHAAHYESEQEKEWYYRWFRPDVVVGVGYWGHAPQLVLHPQRYGLRPVPWLVADGYLADYQEVLDSLPLILVTSRWVRSVYARDGLTGKNIEVLPVGCDTDCFVPHDRHDPKVVAVREALGVGPDQIMILTVGGDATSKGAQEVMQALAPDRRKGARLEVRLQGLAAGTHQPPELDRPEVGGPIGDRQERGLRDQHHLAGLHAVSAGGVRHLRRALAPGGVRNASGRGQCLRQAGHRHQGDGPARHDGARRDRVSGRCRPGDPSGGNGRRRRIRLGPDDGSSSKARASWIIAPASTISPST